MLDQAEGLRRMVERRLEANSARDARTSTRERSTGRAESLVFTSGKGGVGTSNIALNVGVALAAGGRSVLLIDADLGLANIDILCGITSRYDLSEVFRGGCSLSEAVVDGPLGLKIIPGSRGSRPLSDVLGDGPRRLAAEFSALEEQTDFLLIDAGSGLGAGVETLTRAASEAVIVTTPEPTSLSDAFETVARFRGGSTFPRWRLVINQARSEAEADEASTRLIGRCRDVLGITPEAWGHVRHDRRVPLAVRSLEPFVTKFPESLAAQGARALARSLVTENDRRLRGKRPGFFVALAASRTWIKGAS